MTAVAAPRGDIPGVSELSREQAGGDYCCYCGVLMPWERRRFVGTLATDAGARRARLCRLYACTPNCPADPEAATP